MEVFSPILNQMIYLFALIAIGYLLTKLNLMPKNSTAVLSKLENMLFIPALVLGTFINNFTTDQLGGRGLLLLLSAAMLIVIVPISLLMSRLIYKNDDFLKKIATYGLCFANFGYMGNAIMQDVFPEIFTDYVVFTLPLWTLIYVWGVPVLLISGSSNNSGEKISLAKRLKPLLNPMFVAIIIGMIIGITGLGKYIPQSINSIISASGSCMSPIAMLLTGMTIAASDLRAMLTKWKTYLLSAVRLVAIPLLFILAFAFIPQGTVITPTFLTCAVCSLSMPLGLNTIVVPAGYGKDTTDAAGMALISHTMSIITIPLVFMLFNTIVL